VLHALGAAALVAARGDAAASEGATAALEDAVALDPTVVAYRVDLADAYMVADTEPSIAMAIDLYEDALEQDPENDPVRGRVVVAYQALGNHGDAWAHLERRAAGPKVNAFGAATQAAVLARVSKDLARGEAVLRALLARHAGDRVLRLFLADLLEARGDRRGARATLDAAVEGLPPNDPFVAEARTLALRWRR
jgi:tetratricopeptide (TPR) repeat protein